MENSEQLMALLHPILALGIGSFFLISQHINLSHRYIQLFGLAYVAYAFAVFSQVLVIPKSVPLNMMLSGILYSLAILLFYAALLKLGRRQPLWVLAGLITLVALVLRYYFGVVDEHRALRIYTLHTSMSIVMLLGLWQIRHIRNESKLTAFLFYATLVFALSSFPRLMLSDFGDRSGYGYDGSSHWIYVHYSFYLFFLIFTFTLVILVARALALQAQRLSTEDPLTGLLNRRGFSQHIESKMTAMQNYSLIAIDLDNFKNLNDEYGHPVGDAVLQMVAEQIKKACRPTDILSRFGGEEFLILLPNTDYENATEVAERLRQRIEKKDVVAGTLKEQKINVTASFGVSHFDSLETPFQQAYRLVDGYLYHAKVAGKNRVFARRANEEMK